MIEPMEYVTQYVTQYRKLSVANQSFLPRVCNGNRTSSAEHSFNIIVHMPYPPQRAQHFSGISFSAL